MGFGGTIVILTHSLSKLEFPHLQKEYNVCHLGHFKEKNMKLCIQISLHNACPVHESGPPKPVAVTFLNNDNNNIYRK